MKKVFSIILGFAMLLTLSGFLAHEQTAAASEQSALTAYRQYLRETHSFETWSEDTYTWGVDNLRYAEVIDLDNDGIPEMILVMSLRGFEPFASHHIEYGLVVVGYNGRAVELFQGSVVTLGGLGNSYSISTGAGGKIYFVDDLFDHNEGITTYYTLERGQLTAALTTSSGMNDVTFDDEFFINGARVTFEQYMDAASSRLGITSGRDINYETTNAVQFVILDIENRMAAPPQIRVLLDGVELSFDVPPQTVGGRTLVPLRTIFEALGAEIEWDSASRTVTASDGKIEVILTIGSTTPTVNGRVVTIDQPGIVVSGRTLVPLRFVAESFGVDVNWDSASRTVSITS